MSPAETDGTDEAGGTDEARQVARSGDAGAQDPSAGNGAVVVQRGKYYDELPLGATYLHRPGRTLTEADNVWFTTMTMNSQALHLDAAWSATQPFGRPLINSLLTLSTLVGLSTSQLTQGTIVANLGFDEVAFPAPLFHGDTLYAESTITGKRPSKSRPGQGVVRLEHVGRNADGVVVARAVRPTLFWYREAHAEAQAGETDRSAGEQPQGGGPG